MIKKKDILKFEKLLFRQFEKRIASRKLEVEQKYHVRDISKIRKTLKKIGARKGKSGYEHNELYDINRTLRERKQILRLRYFGRKNARLTFKGPRMKGRYKKRVEVESEVQHEEMKHILYMLGYRVTSTYRKFREEYSLPGVQICLDHLPNVDWFVEIEGSPSAIKKTARQLGLESRHHEHRSYRKILKESSRNKR